MGSPSILLLEQVPTKHIVYASSHDTLFGITSKIQLPPVKLQEFTVIMAQLELADPQPNVQHQEVEQCSVCSI